jgi:hypothetical protein
MEFYQYCQQEFDTELSKFRTKLGRKKSSFQYHSKYLTVDEFFEDSEKHKVEILNSIQLNKFKFDPLTPIFLPKDKDNYRMVCVPSVKDRLIQNLFMSYLKEIHTIKYKKFATNDFALKGNGGVKAAHDKLIYLRKKHKYALKTDISSFFDELDRGVILQLFKTKIAIPNLDNFFKDMINTDPSYKLLQATSEDQFNKFSVIIKNKKRKGIRQGMPIASLLASFYLQDFDAVLSQKKINYIRYADDLIVFGDHRDEMKQHFELIKQELAKIQLSIPDLGVGKSEIYTYSQTVTFLGLELKKIGKEFKLFIPQKAFTEIGKKVIELQGYKRNIKANLNFYKTCQKIDQICNGYIVCYEFTANLDSFKKHINERKLFVYQRLLAPLGIDYTKLSSEKKKYFFNE